MNRKGFVLPLLWAECLNLCGAGSKYNFILQSHDDGLAKKIAKKVVRLRLRIANKTEAIRQDKVAKPNSYQHWRTVVERTFKYKFPF